MPALPAHLPQVRAVAEVVWRAHYPGIISAAQIEYMLERGYAADALSDFVGSPRAGLELARSDGTIVGFAAWYAVPATGDVKLDKLYVLPSLQRGGIGARLIATVAARAREVGATELVLNVNKRNASALAAYRKHGFTVRESVVVDIGEGYVMDDYVMAKPL